ncbi:MAG: hypothetical protein OSB08_03475 [SAR324 cluster bacterium]|nr:hypothetical protein [SAR324 cluster bacterium]
MKSKNEYFPLLFSPIEIRGRSLRNRIIFGAHTSNMSEQGLPGALELQDSGLDVINIGDSAGSRQAPFVIYEGRRTGLNI